jgi:nucleoid-associated protein YgaU
MKLSNQIFMLGLLLIGSLSMTACSSKKVGEADSAETVETADAAAAGSEAQTDAVPDMGAEGELASVSETPPADQAAVDAASTQPSAESVASNDQQTAMTEAPVTDDSLNTPADVPVTDAPTAPTDNVVASDVADAGAEPAVIASKPKKKSKKGKKSKAVDVAGVPASSGPASDYQVKAGDTLMKIAFEQYGDLYRWKEIYNANREVIADPNNVPPGTRLTLNGAGMVTIEKSGESYLIKRGDTLGIISNDVYGTVRKWKKLWENNRQLIKDPNKIYAGFYLYYIPEGKLTREEVAPGLKKDDSAMNAPVVGDASRVPASNGSAPAAEAVVPAQNAPAKN